MLSLYRGASGTVVAVGTSEEIAANPASYTGHYLKQVLERRPSGKTKRAAASAAAEVKIGVFCRQIRPNRPRVLGL